MGETADGDSGSRANEVGVSTPLRLTRLEVAAGLPFGQRTDGWTPPDPDVTPRRAFEDACREGLSRPPCLVSFSGGRDSSAVLAVATEVARAEGHALPIPLTHRPAHPASSESEWQELVVRHLDLPEWEQVPVTDDLELVGPIATDVLDRHGILWPPNTFLHDPLLERASGGALLTGIDGDGALANWRWLRLWHGRGGGPKDRLADLAWGLHGILPPYMRGAAIRLKADLDLPWLQPEPRAEVTALRIREVADQPVRWGPRTRWFATRKRLQHVIDSFGLVAADHDVRSVHPFADGHFLTALAAARPVRGYGSRTAAMRALFADVLPAAVVERSTKAAFNPVLWGPRTRAFMASWDGTGGDASIVDPEALAEAWRQRWPDVRTELLLHEAWLAARHA